MKVGSLVLSIVALSIAACAAKVPTSVLSESLFMSPLISEVCDSIPACMSRDG